MTKGRIAVEFARGSRMVQLVDKGIVIERADAEAMDYIVSGVVPERHPRPETVPAADDGQAFKARSWRAAIGRSPEAKGRDDATAEILVRHSPETLSAEDARAFLRGLPTEQHEQKAPTVIKTEDPRAARKAEIAGSMASFNQGRGFAARQQTRMTGAPSLNDIEPAKLKRLAEIRLNALEAGQAHRVGDEAKKLRYALQVHDQTGLPLANVFTQLGVDTAFIR